MCSRRTLWSFDVNLHISGSGRNENLIRTAAVDIAVFGRPALISQVGDVSTSRLTFSPHLELNYVVSDRLELQLLLFVDGRRRRQRWEALVEVRSVDGKSGARRRRRRSATGDGEGRARRRSRKCGAATPGRMRRGDDNEGMWSVQKRSVSLSTRRAACGYASVGCVSLERESAEEGVESLMTGGSWIECVPLTETRDWFMWKNLVDCITLLREGHLQIQVY